MTNHIRHIIHSTLFLGVLAFAYSLSSCAKPVDIHKKWRISSGDDTQLIDLSVPGKVMRAFVYDAEFCKEVHGAYEPGVFYLMMNDPCRVTSTGEGEGDVEYLMDNGEYALLCSYQNLTADKATFIFEGEFEWDAVADESITVVNPNDLEINVEDLIKVQNYQMEDSNTLSRLCDGKDLKFISKTTNEYGNVIETWGRGLVIDGEDVKGTGGESFGIQFTYNKEEFKMVELFFSDAILIKKYETQLARLGYFKQKTVTLDGETVVTYASDEWEEESDELTYTLKKLTNGLYTLYNCEMF